MVGYNLSMANTFIVGNESLKGIWSILQPGFKYSLHECIVCGKILHKRRFHINHSVETRYDLPCKLCYASSKPEVQDRLRTSVRRGLSRVLRGKAKPKHVLEVLGCDLDFFRKHLEAQFKPGMTWENWAFDGWHLDHIRPIASFDLSKEEDRRAACHYTNLQPLWAHENLSKGAKY